MVDPLVETFPGLAKGGYSITSPANKDYNCIAYAAGDSGNWWRPVPPEVQEVHWPAGIAREETLPAFRDAFASLGYGESTARTWNRVSRRLPCSPTTIPVHAARQRPSGRWTSKLGEREDIDHALHDLEGEAYGSVVLVMKRALPEAESEKALGEGG